MKVLIAAVSAAAVVSTPGLAMADTFFCVGAVDVNGERPFSMVLDHTGRVAMMSKTEAIKSAQAMNTWPDNGNDLPGAASAKVFKCEIKGSS
jgi:hypothetical protein